MSADCDAGAMGLCFARADVADDFWICDFFGFEWYFLFWNEIHSVGSIHLLAHFLG